MSPTFGRRAQGERSQVWKGMKSGLLGLGLRYESATSPAVAC
jgi:hypothetical protein